MKKKIITVALVLSSVCAMAQQKENRDTDGNILRGSYETNSFWSNWYIGVGGGINIYEGVPLQYLHMELYTEVMQDHLLLKIQQLNNPLHHA